MYVLLVQFRVVDLDEATFYAAAAAAAPTYADVPGLLDKTWLYDRATGLAGGVYRFTNRAAADAHRRSDLFSMLCRNPSVQSLDVGGYGVLEAPTRLTHGWRELLGKVAA